MTSPKETHETGARETGVDPSAPPAEAVGKLRSMRLTGAADDAAIARSLAEIAAVEAATMLAEMEADSSGRTRREIRRALFRLRQRGIEPPAEASDAVAGEPGSEAGLSGLLSPIDAEGARIAWLLKPRASGGLKRLWGLASETDGLIGATLETLSRKEFRADRAEIERRAGAPLIEAHWRLVDFILCDAYRRTAEDRRARVGNFLALRAEMVAASPPAADFQHPIYKEFPDAADSEPSSELMREPEVAAFKLLEAVVKPYAEEAAGLQESVIVLSRVQQEERVAAVVQRAIGELLIGDTAYRLRRRLEETAYWFARTDKLAQARWAAAAAAKIRDGADLKRVPFFELMMRAQLGAIIAEERAHEKEEPRLIMTPAEAMRSREAARARMRQRGR
jgi:hypothetical protein